MKEKRILSFLTVFKLCHKFDIYKYAYKSNYYIKMQKSRKDNSRVEETVISSLNSESATTNPNKSNIFTSIWVYIKYSQKLIL